MTDPGLHENRARAGSFGEDADRYDRARPTYPPALVDHLLGDRDPVATEVLDVGCGTGIVSRLFAERGCRVLGVEQDARMAEVARERGTAVEVGRFEEWDAAGRVFDLVVAGQAWHWVDPERGSAKAAEVCRPGGRVGLFWNWSDPDRTVRARFDGAYRVHAPELAGSIVLGGGTDQRFELARRTLAATGGFDDVRVERWWWERDYTTEEWVDLLPTHSDHRLLPPDRLAALLGAVTEALESAGGGLTMRYRTTLVTARRH